MQRRAFEDSPAAAAAAAAPPPGRRPSCRGASVERRGLGRLGRAWRPQNAHTRHRSDRRRHNGAGAACGGRAAQAGAEIEKLHQQARLIKLKKAYVKITDETVCAKSGKSIREG